MCLARDTPGLRAITHGRAAICSVPPAEAGKHSEPNTEVVSFGNMNSVCRSNRPFFMEYRSACSETTLHIHIDGVCAAVLVVNQHTLQWLYAVLSRVRLPRADPLPTVSAHILP